MSGTSLDGVDAALVAFADTPRLLHSHFQPFEPPLRAELLALNEPGNDELHRAALASNQLSPAYAGAIRSLLAQSSVSAGEIRAIGCHGQTVRHRPDAGYTTQLVNGSLLAELTGIRVVCDFRSRDIAAGGQGAPLAPAFHRSVFRSPIRHRAIVNIGGIANITDLPPGMETQSKVTGFDCGPGNVLMDAWINVQLGKTYDEDGAWASQGKVISSLFDALSAENFFSCKPPKSTGRDLFKLAWLQRALTGTESIEDVQATLLELTASTIAHAIQQYCRGVEEVYVCGGGAHNRALMTRLATLLKNCKVAKTDVLGIAADWVEAAAFAWLARQTLQGESGNLPTVTGASGERILGAIYPV